MWRLARTHYLFAFISHSLNLMYEVRSAAWFICFLLTAPTIVFKMPKDPTPLYSHRSRNATARQLNITTNASGRSSYSFTSTHVPVEPAVPEPHTEPEYYAPDSNMDVDGAEYQAPEDLNAIDKDTPDGRQPVEVAPGVHVHVNPPPKARRYDNSVGVS